MNYRTIIYEEANQIGTITLNRPQKLNAINDLMLDELDDLLRVKETDIEVKAIVIKGAGRCFSVGQDLSGEGNAEVMPPDSQAHLATKDLIEAGTRWNRRLEYILNYLKPTIAQVHGYCLGLGLYIAMTCDITIASDDAVFGDPSLRMRLLTGIPLWTWLIGIKKTKELVYLGRYLDAKEAEQICLINKAVAADKLEEEVRKYAKALAIAPGDGMVVIKESLNAQMESRGVGSAWRFLTEMQTINWMQQRQIPTGEFNFWKTRKKKGLKAAIKERDAAVEEFFPKPSSPSSP